MLLVLLLLGVLLTLLTLFLFQGSAVTGICALIFLAAGTVLRLGKKKLSGKLAVFLPLLCLLAGVVFLGLCGTTTKAEGFGGYDKQLAQAEKAMRKGDYDKAVALLEELEASYGSDDNTFLLKAFKNLAQKDYDGAYEEAGHFSDKRSQAYYGLMEQIYLADPDLESADTLYELYLAAAADWPEWTHMQLYAGISLFEQESYGKAEYYLLRAMAQDEDDSKSCFYLGAACFCQMDYENCRYYFNEALKRGADDTVKANIVWYMEQIGAGGEDE